jgi:hypothetical protein
MSRTFAVCRGLLPILSAILFVSWLAGPAALGDQSYESAGANCENNACGGCLSFASTGQDGLWRCYQISQVQGGGDFKTCVRFLFGNGNCVSSPTQGQGRCGTCSYWDCNGPVGGICNFNNCHPCPDQAPSGSTTSPWVPTCT